MMTRKPSGPPVTSGPSKDRAPMKPPAVPPSMPTRSEPMARQANWAKPGMPKGKNADGTPAVPVVRANRPPPDTKKQVSAYANGGPVNSHRGWGSAKKPGAKK